VLGAVAAAVYRLQLAEPLPGGRGLDVRVDTLGAAVATAGSLPATQGELLLDAARAAFVDGFQVAAALSAAVLLATAALAWRRLREAEPDGAEPDGAEPDGAEPNGAEPSRCRETSR
jgi:DHA2 family multidrug resistance protein-like MFS transporter